MPKASFVFPVRYVSEGVAVQTTSRELSALGIEVLSLSPPPLGARVSMALYLPNAAVPEVAVGRVARSTSGKPSQCGFWADFIVVDPQARMRISHLLSDRDQQEGQHRAFARLPAKLQVRFRSASEFVEEHSLNLGRGGIFIESENPAAVDSIVEVEIFLPDGGAPVRTNGIVVHRQPPAPGRPGGVGIQFVNAADGFRDRLDKYMQTLVGDSGTQY